MIGRKLNGPKPKLAGHSLPADVYVRRFIAIGAVEIEAVRTPNALNGGHAG